jgi:hypothetical protein
MPDMRKKKKKKRSLQIGRHLSKLTGTGAKKRKAKIKGSGTSGYGRMIGGHSIRTPRGPASPETRSEVGVWQRGRKYPSR